MLISVALLQYAVFYVTRDRKHHPTLELIASNRTHGPRAVPPLIM